ncbi:MAG TPA: biotin/lipoyl-containing protein [Levilinea sp.]|nr:biotin/lipoyl-containing protein [Levilinea sp.]
MKLRVKIANQTYEVEVGDILSRPIKATVDGEVYEVWPEEVASQVIEAAPASKPVAAPIRIAEARPAVAGSASVVAPIPGTIISIDVQPGDAVEHGQTLCILEAMKMKNAIRSTRSGKIAAIHINVGDLVRHNQALMDFAD